MNVDGRRDEDMEGDEGMDENWTWSRSWLDARPRPRSAITWNMVIILNERAWRRRKQHLGWHARAYARKTVNLPNLPALLVK